MDNVAIESFIAHCDEMMIAEEGKIKDFISKIFRRRKDTSNLSTSKNPKETNEGILLCVIPNVISTKEDSNELKEAFSKMYGINITWLECFKDTEGHSNTLFSIPCGGKDSKKMSAIKSSLGIRWFEDYYFGNTSRTPKDVAKRYSDYLEPLATYFK